MARLTREAMGRRKGLLGVFVISSAASALLTMACALSVTDFLQLIFPSALESAGGGVQLHVNPMEHLLGRVYEWLASFGQMRALVLYALLLLVLYGSKNVCSYLSSVSFAGVSVGVLSDVRNALHRAVLGRPFSEWGRDQQGQWLSRMSNDMAEYEANVLESVKLIVQSLLTILIFVVMLFYIDWKLTLLVVAVMGLGTWLLSVSRRLKRQSKKLQSLNGELMSTTQETLESLKEIKAATAIDYVNERQRNQNKLFTRRRIGLYRRIYAASPLSDFVGNCIVVAILLLGAHRVLGDAATLSPALFVSYLMIYVLLLTPIKDLSNGIAQLKKGRGIEERLAESLIGEYESMAADTIEQEPIENIELQDVCFAYGEHRVLQHLTWPLPMHRQTALTGVSGSGKSTLGRMLVGLLDAQEGAVLVNGARSVGSERRGRIAYIPQEPMLFNATIEENIRLGRPWVSHDDIAAAVRMAQVEPLLATKPEGLATNIGDGGSLLSGGERQRVSIARALVGNPEVVVMDEATAALDAATEQHFMDAVHEALSGRTMVVIAHRAATIARCEHVFNVEEGRMVR